MGSGKTTVGKRVAKRLLMKFVDMDKYIEKKSGMSVGEIFDKFGESEFRRLETEAAKELSETDGQVIATGGGVVLNPENLSALKSGGVIVLLQVSSKTVLKRLENNTSRPLLAQSDKDTAVAELLNQRSPLYRAAASIIVDGDMPINQTANQIVNFAKNYIDK